MVKTKPVFNTLGRDEMLADARTGRNRRNALVGPGVADGNLKSDRDVHLAQFVSAIG